MFLLTTLLPVNAVISSPPQRLIIQFDTSLNAEQQQALDLQIKSIIKIGFSVSAQSTDQRWILNLNPALDEADLEKVTKELSKLDHVQYVEPDQVLKILR